MTKHTFIDPSTLSFPSPSPFSAPSPTPSSSHDPSSSHEDFDPSHESGPTRKRPRTTGGGGVSSEERKEARAHRNRIAAQNSRDRRKAQFAYLERRVAELEEENRRLRAGVSLPVPPREAAAVPVFPAGLSLAALGAAAGEEERLRAERERERERENEELKERIRTLERGWDAVVKALAAQGLPAGISSTTTAAAPTQPAPAPPTTAQPTSTTTSTTTASKPAYTAFPSPAPSNASLDLDSSASPTTTSATSLALTLAPPSIPTFTANSAPFAPIGAGAREAHLAHARPTDETARHLAAGGLVGGARAQQPFPASSVRQGPAAEAAADGQASEGDDGDSDKSMEALFREILASPCVAHAAVVPQGTAAVPAQVRCGGEAGLGGFRGSGRAGEVEGAEGEVPNTKEEGKEAQNTTTNNNESTDSAVAEWANEIEMQRLLDEMIVLTGVGAEMGMDMDMGAGMDAMMALDAAEYVNANANAELGAGLDLGLGLGADMGFGVDFGSTAGWEMDAGMGGVGVF